MSWEKLPRTVVVGSSLGFRFRPHKRRNLNPVAITKPGTKINVRSATLDRKKGVRRSLDGARERPHAHVSEISGQESTDVGSTRKFSPWLFVVEQGPRGFKRRAHLSRVLGVTWTQREVLGALAVPQKRVRRRGTHPRSVPPEREHQPLATRREQRLRAASPSRSPHRLSCRSPRCGQAEPKLRHPLDMDEGWSRRYRGACLGVAH